MKIALIGGHLTPALAVIERLPKDVEIIFIGRKYTFEGDSALSLEYQTITDRGIKFYPLTTGRLQRRLTKNSFSALTKVPTGLITARKILKDERPDVVVGFGGYLSFPVCLAAKSLGIPIIIHEQTLEAGLANKLIGKFADRICISWESSGRFFPTSKTVLTGNPIRLDLQNKSELTRTDLKISEKIPIVYITGGSAGSHAVNDAVESCIEVLLEDAAVIHQTGDSKEFNNFERLETKKNSLPDNKKARYRIVKFIRPEDVGYVMQNASLVVGRSGINTVTELLFLKKPALLIPLPFAQRQEQLKNAEMLKKAGLAEILEQKDLNGKSLLENIIRMLENSKSYTIVKDQVAPEDAALKIYEVIKDVSKKKDYKEKK